MNQTNRPFSVTLLALGVLCVTVLNAVRSGTAVLNWNLLSSFVPSPSPFYIFLTGLVWTLVGLLIYVGLWLGHPWARRWTVLVTIMYVIYYWFDRLVFQNAVPRTNWPFALLVTLLWLIFTAGTLLLPASRKFFAKREINE